MMTGYIKQKHGFNISQKRIGKALSTVSPAYHARRQTDTARSVNPIPYRADYFGHKLHIDQNEKLVMYGTTHVVALDGHSRFVVAAATMPVKSNPVIYSHIYRKVLTTYCMFDQVRVDHGREFFLMLGMQEYLANIRGDQLSLPYQQTESKRNLPIERFWVEVNGRVNYPIKSILVDMDNSLIIDMDNNIHKFCVSFVTCKVANFGLQTLVRAWNCHPIPGRGVPLNIKEMTTRYPPVQQSNVPDTATAMQIYNQTYQGRISEPNQFGDDPLKDHPQFLANRNREFNEICNIEQIYNDVVNENDRSFRHAVHCFIDITERYNALL
ncbi:uncharacterized protein LOC130622420 [Hydractinia symbiolongicarpus]|uniref:uncharacterized protein LOC130622420 n=1 Tax=Hydractinia symbiolongicarpus TaxID=13093 RepID=UPI00254AA54E|nr:uncharacterized protein LOC130622420 [Hydractinia symbiolongicarpus]